METQAIIWSRRRVEGLKDAEEVDFQIGEIQSFEIKILKFNQWTIILQIDPLHVQHTKMVRPLKKLFKNGKHAELWPRKADQKEKKTENKEKQKKVTNKKAVVVEIKRSRQ